MSIAQELQEIAPFFMQNCPLCARLNRIVVLGVYRDHKGPQRYPDMGYSFCNCKNIFYTRFENLTTGARMEDADPVCRMSMKFPEMKPGETVRLIMPDPFFCEWAFDPYQFLHWSPRNHWIIWDKEQFEEEVKAIGFEIVSSRRQMDVLSIYPQTFEIVLKKPVEGKSE